MVNMALELTCNMCGKSGFGFTEECYKGTLIGPKIEPGLVLGTNHKALYVFYKELKPEGHERNYHVEKVDIMEDSLLPWGEFFSRLSALDSWKKEGRLKKATDDEVGLLVKMLKENVPGSGVIKVVLEREGVKELHNRTDYFS